ncbi:unnamed protein product [Brachionus calyciflorus]|uniref:Peptidase S1 domain-containing protein n=1 Tax=Brachionus calyciflorus TaxID=104777 RepID=A0A813Q8D7_9BILA|nr:unnamed protein product [Brachionus calyciflorus]
MNSLTHEIYNELKAIYEHKIIRCDRASLFDQLNPNTQLLGIEKLINNTRFKYFPSHFSSLDNFKDKSLFDNSSKIINGEPVSIGAFPFMASLGYLRLDGYFHSCGATIVTDQHVMTAAHCVNKLGNSYNYTDYFLSKNQVLVVIVGTNSISGYNFLSLFQSNDIYLVRTISYNTAYTEVTSPADIAILKLDKKIVFNERISKIRLGESNDPSVIYGKKGIITGWGYTEKGKISEWLLFGRVTVLNNQNNPDCSSFENTQYCLEDLSGRESNACFGDSGGPLLRFENNVWVQYGIASFVYTNPNSTCANQLPSFYAMVPVLKSWALDQIQSN